jgi:hypothetical protein
VLRWGHATGPGVQSRGGRPGCARRTPDECADREQSTSVRATVEGYISSLLRKYGATDRRELAALAETVTDNPAVVLGGIAGFPPSQTSFVGRVSELAAVAIALDSQRLVTLHGSGGVGKTRLAVVAGQAAADTFPFGGAFVDLVPARDVVTAIAGALDVSDGPNRTLLDAVVRRLGRGRSLLVLDNCEHLIDDAAQVADEILAACPDTVVLARAGNALACRRSMSSRWVRCRWARTPNGFSPIGLPHLRTRPSSRDCAHSWTASRWRSS